MARPKKASKRVDQPRASRPLRELKEDLALDEPEWEEFLRHALDGFTDYEKAHAHDYDTPLRLSEVPEEWFEEVDPLGLVTLRVLKQAGPEIATPVAYFFVQVALPEPDEIQAAPGLGTSWLYLARQEVECPVETRDLAHLALHVPEDFFRGVEDDDMVPLCRLILEALEPIDVSDLHALMVAVASARRRDRTIFHLFKDLMNSDAINPEIKGEMCRGVLESPDEIGRIARRAAEIGSTLRAKGRDVVASSYCAIESPVFYKRHEVLKRHAVRTLVDHVGEPLRDVIGAYFLASHGDQLAAIAMSEGALDLIRGRAEELDDDTVKRLLARAVKTGLGPVRQAAYRAGAERFGPDYARPALRDKARMVRDWAQKYLAAGKTKRGSRARKGPE